MNGLEETLQTILEKAIVVAEQTGEFVVEQGTEVLQQFFMWHAAKYSLGILLSFVIMFAGILFIKLWGHKDPVYKDDVKIFGRWYDNEEPCFFAYLILVASAIASIITFYINAYWLTFVLVAPKLYLIEYFIK